MGRLALHFPNLDTLGTWGATFTEVGAFKHSIFESPGIFRWSENVRLNLIVDVFNAFNRVNIHRVDNSYAQSGRPVSAFNPRQIQVGLKILF